MEFFLALLRAVVELLLGAITVAAGIYLYFKFSGEVSESGATPVHTSVYTPVSLATA